MPLLSRRSAITNAVALPVCVLPIAASAEDDICARIAEHRRAIQRLGSIMAQESAIEPSPELEITNKAFPTTRGLSRIGRRPSGRPVQLAGDRQALGDRG